MKLFAVVNGDVLEDLGENISPTYTRIHYLLKGLVGCGNVDLEATSFNQLPGKSIKSILYNNMIKTSVGIKTAKALWKYRPMVYFAYPHSLTTVQNRMIFRLSRYLGLEIMLDIHDTIEQSDAIGYGKSKFNARFEKRCINSSSLIIALNQPMWQRLREIHHISEDKRVVYIPNAYEDEMSQLYINAYKHIDGKFNIAYLGKLTSGRGIDLLVRACQRLRKKYPYLKLYLYGSYGSSMPNEIKDEIERGEFIVRREVPRREVPQLLTDMDLLVMPYDPNKAYMNFSSPTKLFEYIGTGKPILCTRCESLLEIGSDGSIMYADYSEEDFEAKIELLINAPELREEMSRKVMEMRSNHTWSKRAKSLNEMIKSA